MSTNGTMLDKNVEVSILISIYNPVWDYLKETLDSIENQSFKNFELIVVNDGCDEIRLHELLQDRSFPFYIIKNPINIGLARSLNRGIKECKGKYIARIDDDDIMEKNRLRVQYQFMKKHDDVVAVFSNCKIIDKDGNVISEKNEDINSGLRRKLLYGGNCLYHSSLFVKKETMIEIDGYDEKMLYAQDYDLYLRIMKKGIIYVIPRTLIRFRRVPERISRNKRILSGLFSYYASLKNLKSFDIIIFRTFRVIHGLLRQVYYDY